MKTCQVNNSHLKKRMESVVTASFALNFCHALDSSTQSVVVSAISLHKESQHFFFIHSYLKVT